MPDLRLIATPSRRALLAEFKTRLGHAVPGARLLAEGILGAESTIDFVALEPLGRVVVVLVGDRGDDLELVARGLAQRAWVQARLRDWVQLAPLSGLSAEADVRVLLACPAFGAEAAAALRAVGSERIAAVSYRCVQNGTGFEVLVEHPFAMDDDDSEELPAGPAAAFDRAPSLGPAPPPGSHPAPPPDSRPAPPPESRPAPPPESRPAPPPEATFAARPGTGHGPGPVDPPEPPVFRTGLSDDDLGLSPDELREFE